MSRQVPYSGFRKRFRNTLLASSVLLTGTVPATLCYAGDASQRGGATVVQTNQGSVQGFARNGVTEFLGIPYAAPPIGNLRWRPPVAHAPWRGVLKTIAFGPACAQIYELGAFAGPANNNEDCLYINIFTPNLGHGQKNNARNHKTKLPVMFWSYGGGWVDGESNDYDGSKLASQGNTVVVTFNYRLNLFGYLAHPALDQEGHLFGNYGILDNQFALHWVHDNIANFGGDPDNVTILGQSAGSRNTASQVLSPLSRGLFTHAIFESGAIPTETPLSIAETKGVAFAVAAGCGSGTTPAVAQCLRNLPAATIESLAGSAPTPLGDSANSAYITGIITDGQILPEPAIQQYQTGNFNHVPILDGDVENEGNFALAGTEYYESPRAPLTETQFTNYVASAYSGNAGPGGSPPTYPSGTVAQVTTQYPLSGYPSPQQQWGALETDANYSCPTHHVDQIIGSQVPLYAYEFRDQTAPFYFPSMPGFVAQAYHTSDIQYYWPLYHGGAAGIPQPLNSRQENLSDDLVAAWTNFARTGNPNGASSANKPWPRYSVANGPFLAEGPVGLSTESDAFWVAEHHCAFWDKVLVYQSTTK